MEADVSRLPDGLVAFVKRDCPTCELVTPVLVQLAETGPIAVFSQDDPSFPAAPPAIDDRELTASWHANIEAVPTLLRIEGGVERERALGWHRGEWENVSGVQGLGPSLPDERPGCGSLSVAPDRVDALRARFRADTLQARRIDLAAREDEFETMYERGWSDGLPLIPPTAERVLAMLEGTTRAPSDAVAVVPPNLVPCDVEKVAINAVMAGCKPEYLPVVLAAVEAACTDAFNIHGLLATTMSVGPVIIVNGPIRKRLGMNSGINVFGQGNRANATIGRALQLVIRNVGGGEPGAVDRATFGNPGKVGFCFAEDEEGSPWTPLSHDFGIATGQDALTLFPGEGPRTLTDQISREPESLSRTFAVNLRAMYHPKLAGGAMEAVLAIGPEHSRIFRAANWTKGDLIERLCELLILPGDEIVRGAGGIAEGLPEFVRGKSIPKFRPDGIRIVHVGGGAGLFSAILPGWLSGASGSQTTPWEIQR